MHRRIARLIESQRPWAVPVGETAQRLLEPVFARYRPAKDLLNGVWFGHPLHPALTDAPVGAMTVAALLDVTGQRRAADLAVATGVAAMVASAAAGTADAVDVYGPPLVPTTVHASLMTGSLTLYLASMGIRASGGPRPVAVALGLVGYAGLVAGAYVGGDVVYGHGNMVDRHAWDEPEAGWLALDVNEVPDGKLVAASAGSTPLVLFRDGERISALHAVCAHAGGPLRRGKLVDGCVRCPWHGSVFRLTDGHVVHGPSVYDQPAFEVRQTAAGYEARPAQPDAT